MSLWHNTDGQQKLLLKIGFNAQLMLLLLWLLVLALLLVLLLLLLSFVLLLLSFVLLLQLPRLSLGSTVDFTAARQQQ